MLTHPPTVFPYNSPGSAAKGLLAMKQRLFGFFDTSSNPMETFLL